MNFLRVYFFVHGFPENKFLFQENRGIMFHTNQKMEYIYEKYSNY